MRAIAAGALALVVLASGCTIEINEPGAREQGTELRTESRSVARQGAESVVTDISMGAGRLTIAGGATQLLDATFIYNVPEWRPIVEYSVNDSTGDLIVRQPEAERFPRRTNVRYEWDLRLSNDVPMDLTVDLGAGQSNLDLRGINLGKLALKTGAGQAVVDLAGDWRRDVTATVNAGVGELTLRLPREVGARVQIDSGIGAIDAGGLQRDGDAYVNDAFGETPVTMRIMVNAGVGKINLEVGS